MNEWIELREQILADNPKTSREYERLGPTYRAIAELIRLRHERGLSQDQLARKLGKQQPAIARLESGRISPSIAFLEEVAQALHARLIVRLEPVEETAAP